MLTSNLRVMSTWNSKSRALSLVRSQQKRRPSKLSRSLQPPNRRSKDREPRKVLSWPSKDSSKRRRTLRKYRSRPNKNRSQLTIWLKCLNSKFRNRRKSSPSPRPNKIGWKLATNCLKPLRPLPKSKRISTTERNQTMLRTLKSLTKTWMSKPPWRSISQRAPSTRDSRLKKRKNLPNWTKLTSRSKN